MVLYNKEWRRGHEGPFNAKYYRLTAEGELVHEEEDAEDAKEEKECTLFWVVRYFMDTENIKEMWKKISWKHCVRKLTITHC